MPKAQRIDLVQELYRASSSCADHHDARTVVLLHVETAVDEFIQEKVVEEKRLIFVTGNPGDGKTHLLRRLEPLFRANKVEACLDANERDDEVMLSFIDAAYERRDAGCVVAINEGSLVSLLGPAGGRPWARAVRRQILNPLSYRKAPPGEPERVLVVDLNLRHNLSG